MRVRAVVVMLGPTLVALAALIGGLHYVDADGGNPARTQGNHLAGSILLATAVVVLVLGATALRARRGRTLALAVLVTLAVVGAGFGLAEHALVVGERCACEGL